MPIDGLSIKSKLNDYTVDFLFPKDLLDKISELNEAFFIIDKKVWERHNKSMLSKIDASKAVIFEVGEDKKTFEGVQILVDSLIERSSKKNTVLAVIGGGILQDIAGFAASIIYRGINWIFFPTTMLSQCDSCIGAKTSLNYKGFKNLLGTFYPPSEIYIIPEFLATLTDIDYLSGIGELVKLFLIGGTGKTIELKSKMSPLLERDLITIGKMTREALLIKKIYIETDEFDKGRRNILNFGHCFGHALETATDYKIPHGQAVVLGIMLANHVAIDRGLMSMTLSEDLSKNALLPVVKIDLNDLKIDHNAIVSAMKKDKKRTGEGLSLVMMQENHKMIQVNDLAKIEAIKALEAIL
ncbi:3-dehydroquinate synthase [Candidatus Saganbacteria bacterium]|nr:3-dehydroquinate synthase [Candidatus Saganbacteria bacterium]